MPATVEHQIKILLATSEPPELGPGPRPGVRPQSELEAELESILRATTVPEISRELLRALVLLWHDHLDEAHTISQAIENSDGSFIHAIVHRREPDFANSNYWWRRVGRHPAFPQIAQRVTTLLSQRGESELLTRLVTRGEWQPSAFVAACEKGERGDILREIQRLEFEVLLEHFIGVPSADAAR